jgi:hypothetical protein
MAQLSPVEASSEGAAEAVKWFIARSKERKPWKLTARELVVEDRR